MGNDKAAKEQTQKLFKINFKIKNLKSNDVLIYVKKVFFREKFDVILNFLNKVGISFNVYFSDMIMKEKFNEGNINEITKQCTKEKIIVINVIRRVLQYVDSHFLGQFVDIRSMIFFVSFLSFCIQFSIY